MKKLTINEIAEMVGVSKQRFLFKTGKQIKCQMRHRKRSNR